MDDSYNFITYYFSADDFYMRATMDISKTLAYNCVPPDDRERYNNEMLKLFQRASSNFIPAAKKISDDKLEEYKAENPEQYKLAVQFNKMLDDYIEAGFKIPETKEKAGKLRRIDYYEDKINTAYSDFDIEAKRSTHKLQANRVGQFHIITTYEENNRYWEAVQKIMTIFLGTEIEKSYIKLCYWASNLKKTMLGRATEFNVMLLLVSENKGGSGKDFLCDGLINYFKNMGLETATNAIPREHENFRPDYKIAYDYLAYESEAMEYSGQRSTIDQHDFNDYIDKRESKFRVPYGDFISVTPVASWLGSSNYYFKGTNQRRFCQIPCTTISPKERWDDLQENGETLDGYTQKGYSVNDMQRAWADFLMYVPENMPEYADIKYYNENLPASQNNDAFFYIQTFINVLLSQNEGNKSTIQAFTPNTIIKNIRTNSDMPGYDPQSKMTTRNIAIWLQQHEKLFCIKKHSSGFEYSSYTPNTEYWKYIQEQETNLNKSQIADWRVLRNFITLNATKFKP